MNVAGILMKTLISLGLSVLAILVVEVSPTNAEPPNVLFVSVDDLNDWVGCLKGHPQALTPNIDRLAKRGVLFANAHCAAPACNPSRAAVFCGRMPQTSGVWANDNGRLSKDYPKAKLLPAAFSEAGYRTLGTGKLFHSSSGKKAFDEYYSVNQRWSPFAKKAVEYTSDEVPSKGTDNPRHFVWLNGTQYVLPRNRMPSDRAPNEKKGESFDWGPFDVPDSQFGDTQITDWAIEQLQAKRSEPLFLGVGYYRPHIPLWAPKRFFERFKESPGILPIVKPNDLADVGSVARDFWARKPITAGSHTTVLKNGQWRQAVEAYLACVTYVDHEIGRLMDGLDSSPAKNNTIIVLWSDHGWHLGEKEHWGKWTGWERSTRVPLIVVPPLTDADEWAVGETSSQPVGLIDLYPTLVELCGAKGPAKLDGVSLVPLLREPSRLTDRAVATMFSPGNVSLRTERHRFIRYATGDEELYDLQRDPNEFDNLASSEGHQRTKRKLQERLDAYLKSLR